ncbi:helix-turn-helix domain-containing protein [Candidatus Azambacteria bacterium]|nr:helix-turn-helix domain-containing protein [Candidatus Azambacteria bacterium]
MVKLAEKNKALSLRKEGKSYSQIKSAVSVSKSTLSNWLKDYPLSKERIRSLQALSEQRIENFRKTMMRKRQSRLDKIYREEKKK